MNKGFGTVKDCVEMQCLREIYFSAKYVLHLYQ